MIKLEVHRGRDGEPVDHTTFIIGPYSRWDRDVAQDKVRYWTAKLGQPMRIVEVYVDDQDLRMAS